MIQPKTSYARNGDVNIAYQVIGDGPLDLLFIPAFVSHLDLYWTEPETAAFFRRLASFSRLILFDKRTDDLVPVELGRYVADHVLGARFVELAGNDHVPWLGESDAVVDEVEQFLTGARHATEPDRVLATVLFTDIAGSTERAAELGDDRWRALLDNHNELVRRQLATFRGREVKTLGDGFLATFDGPARAIRCACAIREDVGSLGIGMRAGVHTGECEVIGGDIGGMAVHIGGRVAARAAPGEVLVSSAVRDLVVGSRIEFADRGIHALKGVPGEWRLLAVAGALSGGELSVAKEAGDPLAPNATLVAKGDRTALRLARRAPGAARLMSRAFSGRARRRVRRLTDPR